MARWYCNKWYVLIAYLVALFSTIVFVALVTGCLPISAFGQPEDRRQKASPEGTASAGDDSTVTNETSSTQVGDDDASASVGGNSTVSGIGGGISIDGAVGLANMAVVLAVLLLMWRMSAMSHKREMWRITSAKTLAPGPGAG